MPCHGAYKYVIVLAWLTRLTKTLITVARMTHTVVVVMGSILISVINLAADHSKVSYKGAAIIFGAVSGGYVRLCRIVVNVYNLS